MYLVGGAVLWICSAARRGSADSLDAKVLLASGIITAYTWATAYEFWRGRSEPLVSRWPAIFMLFAHGALFLLRTPLSQVLPWSPDNQVIDSVWLTVLSFEALLFTIAIAFILLAMAKERTELRHKTAALIDPLTGISNRRAFLEDVAELSQRHGAEARPVAVLLADLDHFKSINDQFGHAVGDRVLQVFSEIASRQARARRPGRAAGRRGIRNPALGRGPRERPCHRRAHSAGLRGRRRRRRRPSGRRHRQPGHGGGRGGLHRHPGVARPCRRGALLRQGARPEPGRDRVAASGAGADARHRAADARSAAPQGAA